MNTRTSPAQHVSRHSRAIAARVLGQVTWNRIYRTTSYIRSTLWVVPLVSIALVLVLAPLLRAIDSVLGWNITGLDQSGATALYQTVITLTLSFLVFTFGSLLVAIQIAGGQLTPRIIATTLLRDNVVRYSVGLFVFTLVLTVMALNRVEQSLHPLIVFVVSVLAIACMADFLFLIDYAARLLRPVSIVRIVGERGLKVIYGVYPESATAIDEDPPSAYADLGAPRRVVAHEGPSGIVLAVDVAALVDEARERNGVVEIAPQVGDFVATGDPLFMLYEGASSISDAKLAAAVALDVERTLEQDPVFAFRILVDIALKALSPAINDPTTAVLAIDQVHRLLRVVGRRKLRSDTVRDAFGAVRLILRTPGWDDFVHVSCNEIRACGADNMQIARRMRAMLEDLLRLLPAYRHAALRAELQRLDRTLESHYPLAEDLALARVADVQGLGGTPRPRRGSST